MHTRTHTQTQNIYNYIKCYYILFDFIFIAYIWQHWAPHVELWVGTQRCVSMWTDKCQSTACYFVVCQRAVECIKINLLVWFPKIHWTGLSCVSKDNHSCQVVFKTQKHSLREREHMRTVTILVMANIQYSESELIN